MSAGFPIEDRSVLGDGCPAERPPLQRFWSQPVLPAQDSSCSFIIRNANRS